MNVRVEQRLLESGRNSDARIREIKSRGRGSNANQTNPRKIIKKKKEKKV